MATPKEVYNNWRAFIINTENSIFCYHPNLERILLGLSIFVISSRPLLPKLGKKAEALGILHFQVPDLITAWIDEDNITFERRFNMVMTVSDAYVKAGRSMVEGCPEKEKPIKRLLEFFGTAVSIAGEMSPEKAEALLDDLSTDGKQISTDKIRSLGNNLFRLTTLHGLDIPLYHLLPPPQLKFPSPPFRPIHCHSDMQLCPNVLGRLQPISDSSPLTYAKC